MINGPGQRKRLILLHLIPVAGIIPQATCTDISLAEGACLAVMSLAFACTWLVPSPYNHSYAPVPLGGRGMTGSEALCLGGWGLMDTHQSGTFCLHAGTHLPPPGGNLL